MKVVMAIDKFEGEYRFLSNFWPSEVKLKDGKEKFSYDTVEHAYQAAKTLDTQERAHVALSKTAAEAKKRGKKVTMRPDWDEVKVGVMRDLIDQKFEDAELGMKLLKTGDAKLIEGNWWGDTFWGVCKGVGENWLGRLLMEKREALVGSYSD
jgi:ribA/ribD-fused uncharacterized protein